MKDCLRNEVYWRFDHTTASRGEIAHSRPWVRFGMLILGIGGFVVGQLGMKV